MKATEARKQTENYHSNDNIADILKKISSASYNGLSQISVENLVQGQKIALEKLGYSIYGTLISW